MKKEQERDVERKLVRGVRKRGGRAYKFVSPGNVGVPDRLVVWPDGSIDFVELKTTTGKLSQMQRIQIQRLRDLGANAIILHGMEDVELYLSLWGGEDHEV